MTPPRVSRSEYMTAMRSWSYKGCPNCGRTKIRNVECFCRDCMARLPDGIRHGLGDRTLFPRVYHEAMRFLTRQA